MNLVLFGAPGAGKGTQSNFLVRELNLKHISTGDLFRAAIKGNTALGIEAKSYIDAGNLVPDSLTVRMVKEALKNLDGKGFILDGFPRNTEQAEALKMLLEQLKMKLDKAVFLHVPEGDLVKRLSGRRLCKGCGAVYHIENQPSRDGKICDNCGEGLYQRKDDEAEAIQNRLQVYQKSTAPLKDYYKKSGLFIEVLGTGEVDGVSRKILAAII